MPVEDNAIPLTPTSKHFSSTKTSSSPTPSRSISPTTPTEDPTRVPAFGEAAHSQTVPTPSTAGFSFDIDSPSAERVAFLARDLRGIREEDDDEAEWGETTSRRATGGKGPRRWGGMLGFRQTLGNFGNKTKALYEANIGLLFIALSQLALSCMTVCVKYLNQIDPPVPVLELVWVRMVITYVFATSWMVYRKVPYAITGPPGVRLLLIVRGMSGFFGLFSIYYSLQYLSIADTTVLTFLAPSVTAFGGYLLLGESFSRKDAIAGLVSLVGVVLIARPEAIFGPLHNNATVSGEGDIIVSTDPLAHVTPAQRLGAVGVSLLGVFGAAGAYLSIRAVGTRAHALHTTQWFAMWSVFVSTIGIPLFGIQPVIPTSFAWGGLLIAIGLCGFTAQVFLALGLQRETASRASLGMYIQILFALTFELTLFHVAPSLLSMAGTCIILSSAMFIVLTKPPPSKKAKNLRIDTGSDTRGDRDVEERMPLTTHVELPSKELANVHAEAEIEK